MGREGAEDLGMFRPSVIWQRLRRSKHSSFNTPGVALHVLWRAQGKSLGPEQHRSHVMMMQWCCLDADGACFVFGPVRSIL